MKARFTINAMLFLLVVILSPWARGQSYCSPTATNQANYGCGVQDITVGSMSNSSGQPNSSQYYYDYSSQYTAFGTAGASLNYSIRVGSGNASKIGIYVDWNQDGTFAASEQEVLTGTVGSNSTYSSSFTVPNGTSAGVYRMRVVVDISFVTIDPCNLSYTGEIEDYSLAVLTPTLDIQARSTIDDLNIGNNTVSITAANLTSGTTINSVDIGYSVNNGTPVTQSLSSLGLTPGAATTQNFSTPLNISTPGIYTLKVWVRNPNNAGAGVNTNDTITKVIQACYPLNGSYTIDANGSGGSNYTNFEDAISDLITCGVNGAVTFNVAAGSYTEQLSIPFISGVSSTNTIVFKGAGKNSTTLTYGGQTDAERYTLQLNGVSYVTFEDMTISSTNGTYGYTVHLTGSGVSNNTLKNLNIQCAGGGSNATNTNFIPLCFSGSGSSYSSNVLAYENTVDSCELSGGYFSLSFYGNTSSNANYGNVFSNNTMENAYYYGIYATYLSEMKILSNTISLRTSGSTTTNGYGMYLVNSNNSYPYLHEIRNNRVFDAGRYGIYLSSSDGSVGSRGIMANNMIGGDFRHNANIYGIYMNYSDWWNIYYNSINLNTPASSEAFGIYANNSTNTFNLDVRNNMIRVDGSGSGQAYAVYGVSHTLFAELDYNNYWVTNSSDVLFLGQSISATGFVGALNLNKNSYNIDAPFQSSTNLRYTNGCITGISLSGVSTDIDGATRTTTPNVGADEFINTSTNDIGILSISAPSAPVSTGLQNVVVRLKNFGTNTITSAEIAYIHNGGTPVSINWTGTLLPCGEIDITFSGSDGVTIIPGINNIQAYSSSPDGVADNFPGNDGSATQVCPAMSGNFTIDQNGSGPANFTSFTAAVDALNCSGLNGPVTFTVAAGTYVEQIALSNINGVSAQNTITFDGGTGNADTRILTFGNAQNTNRHTFLLDNMQYVTIKNITIEGQSASYGWALHLFGTSTSNITVQNCNVRLAGNGASSTSTNFIPILLNGSSTSYSTNGQFDQVLIENCKISYGYFGIYVRASGNSNSGLVIRDNTVEQVYYYGIYTYNTNAVTINANHVDMRTNNTNSYGIYAGQMYAANNQGTELNGNTIINAGRYGMYINGSSNSSGVRGQIINNMIGGGFRSSSTRALYLQSSDDYDIFYNSVNADYRITSSTGAAFYASSSDQLDVRNNIFALTDPNQNSGSIYPMYMNGSNGLTCDYNNYYKPGSTNNFIRVSGSNYSAANYKGGGGHNANSYFVEPQFITNLDLHTANGCLSGIPITGVNTDIDGDARSAQPSVGADEGVALDASMIEFINPTGTTLSGTQDISFLVRNTGKTTITSFSANYAINGGTAVSQSWTGTLQPCDDVVITFTGGQAATIPNSGVVTLGAYVGNINGGNDGNQANDTIVNTYCNGPLDGVYTVNPGSAANRNFPDLATVINVMNSCGLGGNVDIQLAAGTYRNQLYLDPNNITGLNTYSLTFIGQDSANTIITFDGGGYTVRLNGADNITFRKLAIENTGSTSAFAVHLTNGADNNVFENCAMRTGAISNTTVITFGIMGNTYTQTGTIWGENNRVENCHITGGLRTVNVYGGASNQLAQNNRFINNYIAGGTQYVAYAYYQQQLEFTGNEIIGSSSPTGALYLNYSAEFTIQRNKINGASNYLLYMSQCSPNTSFGRSLVANNMLGGLTNTNTGYGIFNQLTYNVDFFHNSVYIGTDNNSSRAFYNSSGSNCKIINNIFVSDAPNGHAIYLNTNNTFTDVNHNIYKSASSYLAYTWGTTFFDLPSWQAANANYNTDSYEETPNWVSINNFSPDLHLNNNFAARYGDNTLGINVDVDNDSRCVSAKTIGADESKFVTSVSVNFTVNDTVFVSSPFTAINSAVPGTLNSYQWDFNNDGSVEATTLNATYTFNSPGVKQIKLKSLSCTNADSLIRTVVVITPTAAPEADFIANKYSIAPFEEVILQDLSTNGPIGWLWEITPDNNNTVFYDPFDQSPAVFFGDPGVYEVCLTAQNALGTSNKKCKTAYITVRDVNNMCIGNSSSSAATGEIHDSGGPDAPYGNNENCSFLIDPCASSVTLKFSEFTTANAGHFMRVYDGRDATGALLGTYSSTSGLPGGTNGLTANSGAMFITWQTNATGSSAGFSATWSIVPDTSNSLVAGFTAPDSAFVQALVNFTNTSTGNGLTYSWDFDNDNVEDASSEDASYLFTLDGVYPITLDVSDACGNSATYVDSIVITTPTSTPNADFMADARVVTVTDTVRFTDMSDNGPINWNYSYSPSTITVVGGNAQNPLVLFNDTGFYEVSLSADNAAGTGSITKTAYIHVIEICQGSVSALVPDLGINQVRLNQLNNSSSAGVVGYTSYFNNPTVNAALLDAGGTYDLVVSRNTTLNRMNRKVWIDYNADGDFDDANELVGSESSALTAAWTLNFTVPVSAARGATRMRVGTAFADSTNEPCGPNFYGEIEEYRVVISDDITPPVITRLGVSPVYLELGQTYNDARATATDAVDGNLTPAIVTTNNVNINVAGTYYVYYNVTDAAGNEAEEVEREVIVRPDNTPPVLQLASPTVITVPLDSTFVEPGFTAIDAISGNVTNTVVIDRSAFDSTMVGSYAIQYIASDAFGNRDTQTRIVNVVDIVAPVMTLNGNDPMEVDVFTSFNDPGVNVTDNYDQNVTVNVTSNVVIGALGTYHINYQAVDSSGNIASLTREVIVVDNVAPQLMVNNTDTIVVEVFGNLVLPDASATDNYDNDPQITTSGTYDLTTLGDYTVSMLAEDASGNQSTAVDIVVRVVDTEAPLITLNGVYLTTIPRWSNFTDPGVTITDNYYTGLTATTGGNFITTSEEGLYYITYDVTDSSGNVAAQVTRAINIVGSTTSLNDVDALKFSMYPNPASNQVKLEVNTNLAADAQVVIFNALGQEVQRVRWEAQAASIQLDLTAMKPGIYYVAVNSGSNRTMQKLIISK